jgi:hypothetical protein
MVLVDNNIAKNIDNNGNIINLITGENNGNNTMGNTVERGGGGEGEGRVVGGIRVPGPNFTFKNSKKYYLNLINDTDDVRGSVEVEKIRKVVVEEYGATEVTEENYDEVLKGDDGQVRGRGCVCVY